MRAPSFVVVSGLLVAALVGTRCTGRARSVGAVADDAFAGQPSGGVVLIARGDRVLLRRAYGFADIGLNVRMRADHVLGTGSITKQFTAAAILALVAQGKVSLDDDVRRYVPEASTAGRTVTLDQLLTHTSGLPNVVDRADFETVAHLDHSVEELLALTHGMPPLFEPGGGFHYSDSGYFLLGAVIERVSGRSFGTYLEEELLRPAGLRHTWHVDGTRVIPNLATGYSMRAGTLVPAPHMSATVPFAAGGVYSTADDLWRWTRALGRGEVVPLRLLERGWQARTLPDGSISGYGYGWKVCSLANRPTREHGGFVNGFLASLISLPDDDLTIVVLVNNDGDVPDAGSTARRLARQMLTGSPDVALATLSAAERASLLGRYVTRAGEVREVSVAGDVLVETVGSDRYELIPLSPSRLTRRDGNESVVLDFELDASARAQLLRPSRRCEPWPPAARAD